MTLELYILDVREAIQTMNTSLYRKLDNGVDCFNDKLLYIIANIYADILARESVFTARSRERQQTIIDCLNKILKLKGSPDLDNLVYTDLITIDESLPSIMI